MCPWMLSASTAVAAACSLGSWKQPVRGGYLQATHWSKGGVATRNRSLSLYSLLVGIGTGPEEQVNPPMELSVVYIRQKGQTYPLFVRTKAHLVFRRTSVADNIAEELDQDPNALYRAWHW